MAVKNVRNTSIYTIYLKGQGLGTDGRPLGANEAKLEEKDVRVMCAEAISAKLSEAYASLEVAKELGVFNDEYAEKIINSAKDNNNPHNYRKPYYKADIYKKLNKALAVAGKPLFNDEVKAEENAEFE